ncbi:cilia- and flagella-associated protein 43-like [Vespula squamosa]|uniref:Cilia- and flagella-associated protein 43-like n=1 Tax=Vespula squamosa TaxID=30214 RepID=A0ABD2BXX0_VESSQ
MSKIVILYLIEIKSLENKLTSICWKNDGNLLFCDEFSKICSICADGNNRNVRIKGDSNSTTYDDCYPFVIAFKNGLFLVNTLINETAIRHIYSFTENHLSMSPSKRYRVTVRAKGHNERDSLFHGEAGRITEITMLYDHDPRFEIIYKDSVKYKKHITIANLVATNENANKVTMEEI